MNEVPGFGLADDDPTWERLCSRRDVLHEVARRAARAFGLSTDAVERQLRPLWSAVTPESFSAIAPGKHLIVQLAGADVAAVCTVNAMSWDARVDPSLLHECAKPMLRLAVAAVRIVTLSEGLRAEIMRRQADLLRRSVLAENEKGRARTKLTSRVQRTMAACILRAPQRLGSMDELAADVSEEVLEIAASTDLTPKTRPAHRGETGPEDHDWAVFEGTADAAPLLGRCELEKTARLMARKHPALSAQNIEDLVQDGAIKVALNARRGKKPDLNALMLSADNYCRDLKAKRMREPKQEPLVYEANSAYEAGIANEPADERAPRGDDDATEARLMIADALRRAERRAAATRADSSRLALDALRRIVSDEVLLNHFADGSAGVKRLCTTVENSLEAIPSPKDRKLAAQEGWRLFVEALTEEHD